MHNTKKDADVKMDISCRLGLYASSDYARSDAYTRASHGALEYLGPLKLLYYCHLYTESVHAISMHL